MWVDWKAWEPCLAVVLPVERTAAKRSAPQVERMPPVTLRWVAMGHGARSEPLLCGAISG